MAKTKIFQITFVVLAQEVSCQPRTHPQDRFREKLVCPVMVVWEWGFPA